VADHALPSTSLAAQRILPFATGALALGIFIADTIPTLDIAVAVLYVVVVLMSLNFCDRRGVLLVGAGCVALTILGYILSHDLQEPDAALARCLVSLLAIVITTFLASRILSAATRLRQHADLLDLTQRLSHTGSFSWKVSTGELVWSEEYYRIYELDRSVSPTLEFAFKRIHPEDLAMVEERVRAISRPEAEPAARFNFDFRLLMPDGSTKHLSFVGRVFKDQAGRTEVIGAQMDVTAARLAQESLQQTQSALAHVTRVISLGELTASVAHEVKQPLTAIVTNGEAGLRWLDRDPPDLDEIRQAVGRMITEGKRANDVIRRIQAMLRKEEPQKAALDLADVINEAIPLIQRELTRHRVLLKLDLTPGLPPTNGDRIQLQQVIINLLLNGIHAMDEVYDRPRELLVQTRQEEEGFLLVQVRDGGNGLKPEHMSRLFNAFFTTKANGMGMGLSICRSIIEAHGGRIWASANAGPGATFHVTLPLGAGDVR
jgi:two-component system, LuxR family, sensor kinase FixL